MSAKKSIKSIRMSAKVSFSGDEKMRQFIDFLHAHGINKYISLPEIAVMGDTSSGKSSLLSAIAQLQIPSSDQITTRCPLRLRMEKRVEKWAEVSIKWDAVSAYKDESAWPKVRLENWEDVSAQIAAAQALILERSGLEVAPDVVEVNVYGPECIDLTLIDLPGIVRTVGKNETKMLIEAIESLIKSYLVNKRCVILAIQPANVDFHNSQILADAREVDPETRRTIPVITKPDMIDKGAEGSVKDLLLGEKVDFGMGFHMVKCRGQKALNDGMNMEEGMLEEAHFFMTTDPWRGMDKDLFGVVALRGKLSKLQVRMIQDSIPGILTEIVDRRQEVSKRLEALGSLIITPLERRNYFSALVKGVTGIVTKSLSGNSGGIRTTNGTTFLSEEHSQFEDFSVAVLSKKLANMERINVGDRVVVTTSAGGVEEDGVVHKISFQGSAQEYVVLPLNPSSSLLAEEETTFPFCGADAVGAVREFNEGSYKISFVGGHSKHKSQGRLMTPISAEDITLGVDWLKERIKDNRTNDLPCFLSATVFNSVVTDMVEEDWRPLFLTLLANRRAAYKELVHHAVARSTSTRFPALTSAVLQRTERVVEEAFEQAKAEIVLTMETYPYTQNHYLFETITKMRNKRLKNQIKKMVTGKTEGIAAIIDAAFNNVEKMSMEEHIAHEMQIVLNAYGKVAAKRVIDNVPMIIQKSARALKEALEKVLQVTDEELAGLMVEDERTLRKITQDTEEKRKLDLAFEKLNELRLF